jgi:hypothetical protein
MLESPDPKVRDDTAYPVLAVWTGRGVLDGHLASVGDELVARLAIGPIYQRTFAAISLSWVVLRDAGTAELGDRQVLGWLDTFSSWWRLYIFADRGVAWHDPEAGGFAAPVQIPHAAQLKDQIATVLRLPWRGLG